MNYNNNFTLHSSSSWIQHFNESETNRKRTRTAFTTSQLEALEEEFRRNRLVDAKRRRQLAGTLTLSEKSIKIWFQNRRMRGKKDKKEEEEKIAEIVAYLSQDFISSYGNIPSAAEPNYYGNVPPPQTAWTENGYTVPAAQPTAAQQLTPLYDNGIIRIDQYLPAVQTCELPPAPQNQQHIHESELPEELALFALELDRFAS